MQMAGAHSTASACVELPSLAGVTPSLQLKTAKALLRYLLLLVKGAAFFGKGKQTVEKRRIVRQTVQMSDGSQMSAGEAWSAMLDGVMEARQHIGKLRSTQTIFQALMKIQAS